MQHQYKDYDKSKHERFYAVCVKQPYADDILEGAQRCIILPRYSQHRGRLVVVADKHPAGDEQRCGVVVCSVLVTEVIKVQDMTEEDRYLSGYPPETWDRMYGFCYRIKDPQPMVELPANGRPGIFSLVYDTGKLFHYDEITDEVAAILSPILERADAGLPRWFWTVWLSVAAVLGLVAIYILLS